MTLVSPPPVPTQARRPGRLLPILFCIAGGVILVVGCYLLFFRKAQPQAGSARGGNRPVTIATATATKGDIGNYIKRIGTVTPVYTASIYPQVTGLVKKVSFPQGQIVNEGDPLVDIDDSLYVATLLQAQGALYKDEHVLAQAQVDLARYQDAWKQNAVAKQVLDDQTQLVEQDKGQVQNDHGTVDYDTAQVAYCHIKAPFTGRVGLRLVDPGNLVSAGANGSATPLLVMTQLQPITVVFAIPENQLEEVLAQLKQNAKLTVDAYDSADSTKLASGEFEALDTLIDTTTGTVKVRATFSNDDFVMFPNQFVNAHLLVETLKGVTLLPTSAIQQNGDISFVYVIEDNTAHLRNIKEGVKDEKLGLAQVEGLNPGEVVANSSFDKLQDGGKVMVENNDSTAAQGGKSPAGKGGKPPGAKGGKSPAPESGNTPAAESGPAPAARQSGSGS